MGLQPEKFEFYKIPIRNKYAPLTIITRNVEKSSRFTLFTSFSEKTPDKDSCDKKYFKPSKIEIRMDPLMNLGDSKFQEKYLYISMLSGPGTSFDLYYSF